MSADTQLILGEVRGKLTAIQDDVSEIKANVKEQGERIRNLEASRSKALGFLAAIATLSGTVGALLASILPPFNR